MDAKNVDLIKTKVCSQRLHVHGNARMVMNQVWKNSKERISEWTNKDIKESRKGQTNAQAYTCTWFYSSSSEWIVTLIIASWPTHAQSYCAMKKRINYLTHWVIADKKQVSECKVA